MIVLIGGEKGGTGKTTLATNLAVMRRREGSDVLLIDTDKQSTASYWCLLREDKCPWFPRISSVQKYDKSVKTEALVLAGKYDDIIIDAGGRDSPELRGALLAAEKAVFPLRPSQFDLWTLERMNGLVELAREYNPQLKAFVVINQSSTNVGVKEAEEAKEMISEFKQLTLLSSIVCERIAFRRAAIQGLAVTEYEQANDKAINEMTRLYEEVFGE